MNKTQKVIEHLNLYGSITSLEAIDLYGATRLSAIIFNLRHRYNLNIVNETINFTDRYGNKANYVKYVLINEN